MFKPYIDRRYRREQVDTQPGGATISVTTPSDNPFENAQDVEVYTQVSGGMAGPDSKMVSRAQMRHPVKGTVVGRSAQVNRPGGALTVQPGMANTRVSVAAANKPHAGFMPGMGLAGAAAAPRMVRVPPRRGFIPGIGADPTVPAAASQPTDLTTAITGSVNALATGASNVLGNRYASQAAQYQAQAAAAAAQAEAARAQAAQSNNAFNTAMMNVGQHKTIFTVLMVGGVLALGAAVFLKTRKGGRRR